MGSQTTTHKACIRSAAFLMLMRLVARPEAAAATARQRSAVRPVRPIATAPTRLPHTHTHTWRQTLRLRLTTEPQMVRASHQRLRGLQGCLQGWEGGNGGSRGQWAVMAPVQQGPGALRVGPGRARAGQTGHTEPRVHL